MRVSSSTRFESIASSFSALRTSFRRSKSTSSRATSSSRNSYALSATSSPVDTINSIMYRQASIVDLEEERRSFGSGLEIMEPRPIVYWNGLEERLTSFWYLTTGCGAGAIEIEKAWLDITSWACLLYSIRYPPTWIFWLRWTYGRSWVAISNVASEIYLYDCVTMLPLGSISWIEWEKFYHEAQWVFAMVRNMVGWIWGIG